MTIAELITADEGKTLEFKQDLSSPRNILKTLVAFANTAGGKIIIGVTDKARKPTGRQPAGRRGTALQPDRRYHQPPSGTHCRNDHGRWQDPTTG